MEQLEIIIGLLGIAIWTVVILSVLTLIYTYVEVALALTILGAMVHLYVQLIEKSGKGHKGQ